MLNNVEKIAIMTALGHSVANLSDYPYNRRLTIEDEDICNAVRSQMNIIKSVNEKLIASQDIMKTKQVGDIVINENENSMLRKEKSRLCRELGLLVDLPYRKGRIKVVR
ncbi:MAG: hypothetical protein KAG18_03165 [Sinobacterium sp.]|nr:hypothetical protein [Sinobacterium sp.]